MTDRGFDSSTTGDGSGPSSPLISGAQAQVAAARKRREALVAAGRWSAIHDGQSEVRPTRNVPNYKLVREVHRGGQGVVYLAVQESTGREVAVKVLRHAQVASTAQLARFEREVEVLGRLKHPNVVTIHDCGKFDDEVFLVMDYVAGHPLDTYLRHEKPSTRASLDLFARIADGVNAAHLRGVIHRDLKPSNIRVDENGEPRVLDFGLAKLEAEDRDVSSGDVLTRTGEFIGSLPWSSPEQAEGRSDALDIRTDVYSLGVIFFQLLTGRFPYPVGGNMNDTVRHITSSTPLRPSSIDKTLGHEVETILLKCLAKEPERRYQSAGELARDLRRYLAGQPIDAKQDSRAYVLRKLLRRHRVAVAVVSGFALLLAAGLLTSLDQWFRTQQALAETEGQRKLAILRAEQTQAVADFQSKMLRNIDVEAMGRGIKENFRKQVAASLDRRYVGVFPAGRERTPGEIEVELAAFDEQAAATQAVDVARGVLDEYVLQPAAEASRRQFLDQPLVQARIGDSLGSIYEAAGLYAQAESFYRESVEIRRRELGNDHVAVAVSLSRICATQILVDNHEAAVQLCREALETLRRESKTGDPELALTLTRLGRALSKGAEFTEAEKVYREVIGMRKHLTGDEVAVVATALTNLATLIHKSGDAVSAEAMYRDAIAIFERLRGEDHPDTTFAMQGLASCLGPSDAAAVEGLFLDILARQRRRLGNDHPEVAISLANLGWWLQRKGESASAESLFRESVAINRKSLGDGHTSVGISLLNLARILRKMSQFAAAEPPCREGISIFEKTSADHVRLHCARSTLGQILLRSSTDPTLSSDVRESKRAEAQALLESAAVGLSIDDGVARLNRPAAIRELVHLFEIRDAAEPGQGHKSKADYWRAQLPEAKPAEGPASPEKP